MFYSKDRENLELKYKRAIDGQMLEIEWERKGLAERKKIRQKLENDFIKLLKVVKVIHGIPQNLTDEIEKLDVKAEDVEKRDTEERLGRKWPIIPLDVSSMITKTILNKQECKRLKKKLEEIQETNEQLKESNVILKKENEELRKLEWKFFTNFQKIKKLSVKKAAYSDWDSDEIEMLKTTIALAFVMEEKCRRKSNGSYN